MINHGAATVSVIVVTWNRPTYVDDCLAALDGQQPSPLEVVVVDASEDDETRNVVARHRGVQYVRFAKGAGHMTTARNEGLLHVRGDIVAFLDDDANVLCGWLAAVQNAFADTNVAAVAGRTCNGEPNEETVGRDRIGLLLPNGQLTGHFAANPGRTIAIDHGIGANMSFRGTVMAELGGFRDDYPGTALREDTDIFLRIRRLGYKAVFAPDAVAKHVAAPHVKGRRFDWRYQFFAVHNHAILLVRHTGLRSPMLRRWVPLTISAALGSVEPKRVRSYLRPVLCLVALARGVSYAVRHPSRNEVIRTDRVGEHIRLRLHSGRDTPSAESDQS